MVLALEPAIFQIALSGEIPILFFWKMQSSNPFEGLIFLLACSVHFVRGRFGRLLWDSVEIAPNRRRTKCTEHASKKIRSSKRLELCIFQSFSDPRFACPCDMRFPRGLQKCCRENFSRNCVESRPGKCREISGEILLFLCLQETKLESAQNFSQQSSRQFSPDVLQLRMPNFMGYLTLQTFLALDIAIWRSFNEPKFRVEFPIFRVQLPKLPEIQKKERFMRTPFPSSFHSTPCHETVKHTEQYKALGIEDLFPW